MSTKLLAFVTLSTLAFSGCNRTSVPDQQTAGMQAPAQSQPAESTVAESKNSLEAKDELTRLDEQLQPDRGPATEGFRDDSTEAKQRLTQATESEHIAPVQNQELADPQLPHEQLTDQQSPKQELAVQEMLNEIDQRSLNDTLQFLNEWAPAMSQEQMHRNAYEAAANGTGVDY